MGRQFLNRTYTLGGQPWYLETGRAGRCDACDGPVTPQQRAFRRTFGFLFSREHHFIHEDCMPAYGPEMEAMMSAVRQMRQR